MTIKNILAVFVVSAIATGTLATRAIEAKPATKENVVEVKSAIATTMWFELDINLAIDPLNPTEAEQIVVGEGHSLPICSGSGIICEVELDVSEILAEDEDFEFDSKTVEELLAAGAEYTGTGPLGKVPIYTKRN